MNKNMGTADRIIRTALGLVVAVLIATGKVTGLLAIVLGVIGAAFILTSLVSWCPGYLPLKFSTRKRPGSTSPSA